MWTTDDELSAALVDEMVLPDLRAAPEVANTQHRWRVPTHLSCGTRTEFFKFLERDLPRKRTHIEFVLAPERRNELILAVQNERDSGIAQRDRHLHRRERQPLVAYRQRESPVSVRARRREVNAVWMPEDDLPWVTPRPGARLEPASECFRIRARQIEQSAVSPVCAAHVDRQRSKPTEIPESRHESHAGNSKVPPRGHLADRR